MTNKRIAYITAQVGVGASVVLNIVGIMTFDQAVTIATLIMSAAGTFGVADVGYDWLGRMALIAGRIVPEVNPGTEPPPAPDTAAG